MKTTVRFAASLALLVLVSCSTANVRHDYDEGADFAALKTYAWVPAPTSRAGGMQSALVRTSILDKRIRQATDRELAAKGFTHTAIAPDFLVAFHVGAKNRIDVRESGYGYRRYGLRHGGIGTRRYQEGILILDVIDTRSRELIWRGVATKTLDRSTSRNDRIRALDEIIAEMLADFPPST